ncbi:MAG: DNA polymerase III subunit chi [Paracoccaceae bacterium]|nr:DNA polymerase III subunit chi [Paracoccaceae bacterium]
MGAAYFYHLTQRPLEAALPVLIERALAQGWRVAVRGTDQKRMDWLDKKLWLGPDEQFIPHGLAGGPHDALQPVLLTTAAGAPNGAACLMAVDGAEVAPEEARALERVCVLFDGGDAAAVERARSQWKALTEAGVPAQYWAEEGGRWQKKAERAAGA